MEHWSVVAALEILDTVEVPVSTRTYLAAAFAARLRRERERCATEVVDAMVRSDLEAARTL